MVGDTQLTLYNTSYMYAYQTILPAAVFLQLICTRE